MENQLINNNNIMFLRNTSNQQIEHLNSLGYLVQNCIINAMKQEIEIIYVQPNGVRFRNVLTVLPTGITQENSAMLQTPIKRDHKQTIMQLLQKGYTQSEIAAMLGVSQSYVSQLKNEY